jgi:hypothetical protein
VISPFPQAIIIIYDNDYDEGTFFHGNVLFLIVHKINAACRISVWPEKENVIF